MEQAVSVGPRLDGVDGYHGSKSGRLNNRKLFTHRFRRRVPTIVEHSSTLNRLLHTF